MPRVVASELYRNYTLSQALNADLETIEELRGGRLRSGPPLDYVFEQPREVENGTFAMCLPDCGRIFEPLFQLGSTQRVQ